MKNTIKRILLLLPVIALLLAFLAVPAFADYSPETGWSEPVGVIEPMDDVTFQYWDSNGAVHRPVGSLGSPFDLDGVILHFRYKVVFYIDDSVDYQSGVLFSGGIIAYGQYLRLATSLSGHGIGSLKVTGYLDNDVVAFGSGELVCYFEDYPFIDNPDGASQNTLSSLEFEVYEIAEDVSPIEPIGNVWTEIMTWITTALNSVMGAFYVDGSLTLLGTLAVIGVSVGIGFLILGLIQRFLHLRG